MGDDVDDREAKALEELEGKFVAALADKDQGRLDEAEDAFREILRTEWLSIEDSHAGDVWPNDD